MCDLDEPAKWKWQLRRVLVTTLWGVARRQADRLAPLGITTAWGLACANPKRVRQHSNVCMERIIEELNCNVCLPLEGLLQTKKQIYCSRSFGKKATSLQPVLQAVSLYATRAAEKLRQQQYVAHTLHVFIQTSP